MNLVTPGLGLIFWQLVTFLLVLFLLAKFAWKPIMSSLREREESIEGALRAAEQAKTDMAKLKAENEKLLEEARVERDAMLRKAQQTSEAIVEEAKNKASVESAKIVESAKQQINAERQAALADIKRQVATLSIEIAEKLLRNQLKEEKAQRDLVDQLVKDASLN
ncbi:F0F1 ATP synthase subunit B [Rhodocytophaga aerolata]|uniref:ATP synthase subunit b n=1 Tax=Rhodocytophaga aerolata TaxID=455078 RepID=A0ABT8RBM9_9BACT|nr:F0F1 ATP synthase subunit B [Rhodocytophaga aerolata]MDO1448588.1 F0F1 ATP synthase subunit B [Rhodocytophaga aerolata]